ncbi:MAG: DHH family phosphoesterase, partial [Planctomycetota bacterium]
MPQAWRFRPHDTAAVTRLAGELGVAPLTAQVLIARGLRDRESAAVFLGGKLTDLTPPADLPGVADAAARLADAVLAGRRITVYGDYDVDGMTAAAILLRCLHLHGAEADFHVPCRLADGYGLKAGRLRELAAEDAGRLVVTVDCGVASVAEADVARELGLELVVTDHHTPGDTLPAADAVVHPALPGREWPDRHACGAGVAFRVAWEVCRRLADGGTLRPAVKDFLTYDAVTLAALGTVADVVPL